jgi:hypothetical protein
MFIASFSEAPESAASFCVGGRVGQTSTESKSFGDHVLSATWITAIVMRVLSATWITAIVMRFVGSVDHSYRDAERHDP